MRIFYTLLIVSASLFSNLQADDETYAPLSPSDEANFNQQMAAAIQQSQNFVDRVAAKATSQSNMPMMADKMQLQNAMIVLDVKKTLVGNFTNTLSIRSPRVRQFLLQVLTKDNITTADLAELQALVRQERPKVEAYDAAHRPSQSQPEGQPVLK